MWRMVWDSHALRIVVFAARMLWDSHALRIIVVAAGFSRITILRISPTTEDEAVFAFHLCWGHGGVITRLLYLGPLVLPPPLCTTTFLYWIIAVAPPFRATAFQTLRIVRVVLEELLWITSSSSFQ